MTQPETGRTETLEDGLRRVLAPNPGPMTHWGTNTFIVGEGEVAIIDPGPEHAAHFDAILAATRGETVTHILVTHAHLDHSPLASRLSEATGAPVLAFGRPDAGRSPTMAQLAQQGVTGGGEGVDRRFRPDRMLVDGERITGPGWVIEVLHTPGHFAGHLAFSVRDTLISGDHVMDWASTLISPPDGDLSAFMATSRRLRDAGYRRFYPGHGAVIDDATGRLDWLIRHREARETTILDALGSTLRTLQQITERVYRDLDPQMLPAAERNVFAHLVDLHQRGLVRASPKLGVGARYALV